LKDWGDAALKFGPAVTETLTSYVDKVLSPLKSDDGKTWSLQKTRRACAPYHYARGEMNRELAAICLEHNVEQSDFDLALEFIKSAKPKKKNIPSITIKGEDFGMKGAIFRRLPANDIRGLFLGNYTDCCQHISGAGAASARHGYESANSGFYVIENAKKQIVGQSWAWLGTDGELCFDSLERLGQNVTDDQWIKLLDKVSERLEKRPATKIRAVTVGLGGETPAALGDKYKRAAVRAYMKDHCSYTDANSQYLIWERKKTSPSKKKKATHVRRTR
jgi:hypothetical protein